MSTGHTFLTAEQLTELKKNGAKIALVDADVICYAVGFSCEKESSWALVEKTVDNMMRKIINGAGCNYLIGFLTNGALNYRIEAAKTVQYKGNRTGKERPKWYKRIKEYLISSWHCQVMHGIEADDALAIAQKYFNDNEVENVLCTIDKDLDQSPGHHYNWNSGISYFIDEEKGDYLLWRQVITGDMGTDNIPGLSQAAWMAPVGHRRPIFEDYLKVPNEPKMTKKGPSERKYIHCTLVGYETIDDPAKIAAPSDQTFGKVAAEEILKGVPRDKLAEVVLNAYVDEYYADDMVDFTADNGVMIESEEHPTYRGEQRFNEVFKLIYMLRTVDEIPNDAVIDFTPQCAVEQTFNDFDEEEEDVLAEFDF